MSVEQRRAMEESLLDVYYETLKIGCVEGYSLRDLRRDFQAGLGAPLTTWVIAGGMLDFSGERGTDCMPFRSRPELSTPSWPTPFCIILPSR